MINIESEENEIYKNLEQISKKIKYYCGQNRDEIVSLIVSFQRDIEYIISQIDYLHTPKTSSFLDRIKDYGDLIQKFVEKEEYLYLLSNDWKSGLLPYVIKMTASSDFEKKEALTVIENIKHLCLIPFFSDFRLINRIISLPIEEKIKTKETLAEAGLAEVIEALDSAEDNIISKDFKDAADRCREALEKTIESAVKKLGEQPKKFSENLRILQQKSVIDQPLQTDYQGYYSYLAQLGLHGKGTKETLDISANYLLDETYRKIIKFLELAKKKKVF